MSVSATLAAQDAFEVPLGFPTNEAALAVSPTRPGAQPPGPRRAGARASHRGARDDRDAVRDRARRAASDQRRRHGHDPATAARARRRPIHASFVVGADGGRSTVRDLLGIEAVGPTDLEHHGIGPVPRRPVVGGRRSAARALHASAGRPARPSSRRWDPTIAGCLPHGWTSTMPPGSPRIRLVARR